MSSAAIVRRQCNRIQQDPMKLGFLIAVSLYTPSELVNQGAIPGHALPRLHACKGGHCPP